MQLWIVLLIIDIHLYWFHRRKKAWCWDAKRFPTVTKLTNACFWYQWTVDVHLWWPSLSFASKFDSTIWHGILTPQMQAFNAAMSNVRTSVEWLFGDVINYFKFLDFKKNLKIGLSSIGKMYVVCALLRNALTCLYGNETSEYFGLQPPQLQDYFVWYHCMMQLVIFLLTCEHTSYYSIILFCLHLAITLKVLITPETIMAELILQGK